MYAGIPNIEAAYDNAWAWFPDEWVQTEETLPNWSILLKAPLALKAPIFCKF